jgi:hypothetical protein
MAEIFSLFKLAESYLYIILGIIGFIYLRKLIISIGEYRNSSFGMEKDNARGHLFQAGGVLLLVLIVVIGEFAFISYIETSPTALEIRSTPTLNLSATDTPMVPEAFIPPEVVPVPGIGAGTVSPTAAPACETGKIEWTSPKEGEEIKGSVELKGTANIPDFGFYKYEFSQDNVSWTTMQANREIVNNGVLGVWDTTLRIPGDYYLRLVVYNNQETALPACIVKVRIIPE